jgi:integrative and conjugative element protein (TIGR02256 family)
VIDNDLLYGLGGPRPRLVLRKNVLRRFEQHRQLSACSMEAGGQLFARFAVNAIIIEKATGPYRSDQRSRSWFVPDRAREQRDIGQAFRNGLHFIGNWHTHPQGFPSPSTVDIKNTAERFTLSKHTLTAFLLAVVGNAPFPQGLYLALINATCVKELVLCRGEDCGMSVEVSK